MNRVSSLMLSVLALLTFGGCVHAMHTTEVQPGVSVSASAYRLKQVWTRNNPDALAPDQTQLSVVQVNAGYGWRLTDNIGLSAELMVPAVFIDEENDASAEWSYLLASGIDVYAQLLRSAVDLGAGVTLGLKPELYAQTGKGFETSFGRLGIDGGARLSQYYVSGFALASWRWNGISLGLFGERSFLFASDDDEREVVCDENCDNASTDDLTFEGDYIVGFALGFDFALE